MKPITSPELLKLLRQLHKSIEVGEVYTKCTFIALLDAVTHAGYNYNQVPTLLVQLINAGEIVSNINETSDPVNSYLIPKQ